MGFRYGEIIHDGSGESSREGIASSDRIGHFHVRRRLERSEARHKDVASVYAAGEDDHLQTVPLVEFSSDGFEAGFFPFE